MKTTDGLKKQIEKMKVSENLEGTEDELTLEKIVKEDRKDVNMDVLSKVPIIDGPGKFLLIPPRPFFFNILYFCHLSIAMPNSNTHQSIRSSSKDKVFPNGGTNSLVADSSINLTSI